MAREKLKSIGRAECSRKKKERVAEEACHVHCKPLSNSNDAVGDKRLGTLKKSKERMDEYLRHIHSDSKKCVPLKDYDMLLNPPLPASEFNYANRKLER